MQSSNSRRAQLQPETHFRADSSFSRGPRRWFALAKTTEITSCDFKVNLDLAQQLLNGLTDACVAKRTIISWLILPFNYVNSKLRSQLSKETSDSDSMGKIQINKLFHRFQIKSNNPKSNWQRSSIKIINKQFIYLWPKSFTRSCNKWIRDANEAASYRSISPHLTTEAHRHI